MTESTEYMKLEKKIIIDGTIELKTGLHIGGTETGYEIGTIDSPVIRDGFGRIYIPGSSIKGKMRSLLEKSMFDLSVLKSDDEIEKENKGWKKVDKSWIHECNDPNCPICTYFGRAGDRESTTPTRIHVYDAYLQDYFDENDNLKDIGEIDFETEVKGENTIDRLTSTATPRFFERVPAGSKFKFRIVIDVYTHDNPENIKKTLIKAMKLLEDDYLGGSGSRGYGRIRFNELSVTIKEIRNGDYVEIGHESVKSLEDLYDSIKNLLKKEDSMVVEQ